MQARARHLQLQLHMQVFEVENKFQTMLGTAIYGTVELARALGLSPDSQPAGQVWMTREVGSLLRPCSGSSDNYENTPCFLAGLAADCANSNYEGSLFILLWSIRLV